MPGQTLKKGSEIMQEGQNLPKYMDFDEIWLENRCKERLEQIETIKPTDDDIPIIEGIVKWWAESKGMSFNHTDAIAFLQQTTNVARAFRGMTILDLQVVDPDTQRSVEFENKVK